VKRLNVLITRDGLQDQEAALADGFRALGCTVHLERVIHGYQFKSLVTSRQIDLAVQRCYSQNPYSTMLELRREGHKCRFAYWEKGWPRFLRLEDPRRKAYDVCFTACNDGSGVYLPQASADHSHLRENTRYGLTLVGANKISGKPAWGETRPALHKRLRDDLGNPFADGMYNIHSALSPYSKRFAIMANSWASIGIWNLENGVPLRHHEIVSCGTPLFNYPWKELTNLYTPGKHYVEAEALSEAVSYYKEHPEELAAIAEAGHRHFLENHTYVHRARKIITTFERWRHL